MEGADSFLDARYESLRVAFERWTAVRSHVQPAVAVGMLVAISAVTSKQDALLSF